MFSGTMRTPGSRRSRGVVVTLAVLAALAFPALAQDSFDENEARREHAAPNVVVEGTGENIQAGGANVTITGEADDIQAAGASVTIRANAQGDVQVAGAVVQQTGTVAGNVQIAAATVEVRGNVAGGVDAAGATVWIGAAVGRDVRAAGANVTLSIASDVGGDLKAAAANLAISGHVAGDAMIGGALVTINGRIDGSVDARAAQVIVNSGAVIGGDLVVYSLNDPIIAEGATVTGTVTRYAPPSWWGEKPWWWKLAFAGAVAAGTILAGIVLMLFGGKVFAAATGHVRHSPLSSFLFGVLALVLIPFVAVVLMATVVGLSVGIAIGLIVPFLLVFGHAVAAAGIAAGILVRRPGDIGVGIGLIMLILGAILLVAIGFIPFVGPFLVLIAVVLGTGAFTRTIGARMRRAVVPAVQV